MDTAVAAVLSGALRYDRAKPNKAKKGVVS
jgi:hypothetical protein